MFTILFVSVAVFAIIFTLASTHPLWDGPTKTIWGAFAMVLWAVFASQAGRVVEVSQGDIIVETHLSLIIVGWLFAFVMFIFVAVNAIELIQSS